MTKKNLFPKFTIGFFCICLLFLPSGKTLAKLSTVPSVPQKDLMEVKVYRLIVDPGNMQPVLLLTDLAGERAMPIWIGPLEASAIQAELEGVEPPRPMTHDLMEKVIQRLNGVVKRAVITQQKENIYHALLVIEKDRTLAEIDARPSDSIIMALKFKAPIFIAKTLFRDRAVPLSDSKDAHDPYGLTLQELTPMLAESFGFKKGRGVLVADVKEGSRSEKDGIQRGDILVEIGGEKVEDVVGAKNALAKIKKPGKVKIFRQGNFVTLPVSPVP